MQPVTKAVTKTKIVHREIWSWDLMQQSCDLYTTETNLQR